VGAIEVFEKLNDRQREAARIGAATLDSAFPNGCI